MAIIRRKRTARYQVLGNEVAQDRRLTAGALGVLIYILSERDDYQPSAKRLAKETNLGGREAIEAHLRVLRECGYVVHERVRDPDSGRFRVVVTVYDKAQTPDSPRRIKPIPAEPATPVDDGPATACRSLSYHRDLESRSRSEPSPGPGKPGAGSPGAGPPFPKRVSTGEQVPTDEVPTDEERTSSSLGEGRSDEEGKDDHPRQALGDAMVEVGLSKPTTAPAHSRRAKVVRGLLEAGATPEQVKVRAKEWKRRGWNYTLTDTALLSHWDDLGTRSRNRRPSAHNLDDIITDRDGPTTYWVPESLTTPEEDAEQERQRQEQRREQERQRMEANEQFRKEQRMRDRRARAKAQLLRTYHRGDVMPSPETLSKMVDRVIEAEDARQREPEPVGPIEIKLADIRERERQMNGRAS